jgi:hypothetical protein
MQGQMGICLSSSSGLNKTCLAGFFLAGLDDLISFPHPYLALIDLKNRSIWNFN